MLIAECQDKGRGSRSQVEGGESVPQNVFVQISTYCTIKITTEVNHMLNGDVPLGGHITRSVQILNNEDAEEMYIDPNSAPATMNEEFAKIHQQYQQLLQQHEVTQNQLQEQLQQNQMLLYQLQQREHLNPVQPVNQAACVNLQLPSAPNTQEVTKEQQESATANKRKRGLDAAEDQPEQTIYNVTTQNRYDPLGNVPDPNLDLPKIPPINVIKNAENVPNFTSLIAEIQKLVTNDFTSKVKQSHIAILFTSIDDFRKFRKYCDEKEIQYFTYREPTKKNYFCYNIRHPYSIFKRRHKIRIRKNVSSYLSLQIIQQKKGTIRNMCNRIVR